VRQLWSVIGMVVTGLYLGTVVYALVAVGHLHLQPVWLTISVVFALERVVTVRSRGFAQMALSAVLVVEMPYDIFLQGRSSRYLGALSAEGFLVIMYHPGSVAGGAAGAVGECRCCADRASGALIWLVLAAFALLTAGGALLRTAPSLHRRPTVPCAAGVGAVPSLRAPPPG